MVFKSQKSASIEYRKASQIERANYPNIDFSEMCNTMAFKSPRSASDECREASRIGRANYPN